MAQSYNNGGNLGFEAELFKAADKLRGNMEPSDYKHVALGLIFLKYISDAFEARHFKGRTQGFFIGYVEEQSPSTFIEVGMQGSYSRIVEAC